MEETKDKKGETRQREGEGEKQREKYIERWRVREGERQRLKKQRMIRFSHMFYDVVYDMDDIK